MDATTAGSTIKFLHQPTVPPGWPRPGAAPARAAASGRPRRRPSSPPPRRSPQPQCTGTSP
eukprot:11024942-Alexandrium_andersonii.AAC.1